MRVRLLLCLAAIIFISNLNALVDYVLHPEIPYFDAEHIIVGSITAVIAAILFGAVFLYMNRLEIILKEREKLEESILEIEERERQRIGHDLHDDLGQLLTGIAFKSQTLLDKLKNEQHPLVEDVIRMTSLIDQTKEHAKDLSRGLSPIGQDSEGFIAALDNLASYPPKAFGISCVLECKENFSVNSRKKAMHLYRIVQEAVTNAVKHAAPKQIKIYLEKEHDKIKMTVKDDGTGFAEVSRQINGMGLQIMKYRANMIGASLDIDSEINRGTNITCAFSDKYKE